MSFQWAACAVSPIAPSQLCCLHPQGHPGKEGPAGTKGNHVGLSLSVTTESKQNPPHRIRTESDLCLCRRWTDLVVFVWTWTFFLWPSSGTQWSSGRYWLPWSSWSQGLCIHIVEHNLSLTDAQLKYFFVFTKCLISGCRAVKESGVWRATRVRR